MPPFRPCTRALRALELPKSYVPRRALQPNFFTPTRRCISNGNRDRRPKRDPLEEWQNPRPSKWPNKIRLLMLPFIGAIIYSMVFVAAIFT